mmetsp:Transcript_1629/g.3532  ORF Transcript_1629/g.3532 Transcript_1629/m.3532 type:complete len:245 (+) Transcript_1629:401-1135(+)
MNLSSLTLRSSLCVCCGTMASIPGGGCCCCCLPSSGCWVPSVICGCCCGCGCCCCCCCVCCSPCAWAFCWCSVRELLGCSLLDVPSFFVFCLANDWLMSSAPRDSSESTDATRTKATVSSPPMSHGSARRENRERNEPACSLMNARPSGRFGCGRSACVSRASAHIASHAGTRQLPQNWKNISSVCGLASSARGTDIGTTHDTRTSKSMKRGRSTGCDNTIDALLLPTSGRASCPLSPALLVSL